MTSKNSDYEYQRELEPRLANFDGDIVDMKRVLIAAGITLAVTTTLGAIAWSTLKK